MKVRASRGPEKFKADFRKGKIHEESSVPPEAAFPSFSLRYVRKGYCVSDCQKDDKAAFADAVRKITQCSWQELYSKDRHALGFEKISRDSIKGDSIPNVITPDVQLLAFRFSGKKPMVGFRGRDNVFYVLWLDRAFRLYKH